MCLAIWLSWLSLLGLVSARINVTVQKYTYEVFTGDDLTLQCSIVSDEGLDSVHWKKSWTVIYSSDSRRTDYKYSGSTTAYPSLTIHNVQIYDTNYYYCCGKKERKEICSRWIHLKVKQRPKVTVSRTSYIVKAGQPITLTCEIQPASTLELVYWTKLGHGEIFWSSLGRRLTSLYWYDGSTLQNPSLIIKSTKVDDSGSYTCVGRISDLDFQSSPVRLRVHKPFTASVLPNDRDIATLEGMRLEQRTCISRDCGENCDIQWTLPNGEKSKSDIFTEPIRQADAGKYTCTVRSMDVEKSKSFYVSVNYGPKDIALSPPTNMTVREGRQIPVVTCQAQCSPSCSYVWRGPDVRKYSRPSGTLSLGTATKSHAGVYVCMAKNDHGNLSIALNVNVEYGPTLISFTPITQSYRQLEGYMMEPIRCSADCNPTCHISWSKDGHRFSSNGVLALGSLDRSKDGTYICTARGGNMHINKTITVKTLYGPRAISISSSGNLSAEEGQRISIGCQADCSPPCNITWAGPNTDLAFRYGRNLIISKAGREDNGEFVCTASNQYGKKNTSLRINIHYAGADLRVIPDDIRYSIKEGTAIPDIRCEATCNPACEISWHHDRTGHVINGRTLSLGKMERSKDGNYTCKAANSQGTQTLNVSVVSLFPPEVLQDDPLNTSYVVNIGDVIRDSFSIDACPTPHAFLLYEGTEDQKNISIQEEQQRGSYRTIYSYAISNITYSDVGIYTLTVSNSQGTFLHKFSIKIANYGSLPQEGGGAASIPFLVWIILVAVVVSLLLVVAIVIISKHNKERKHKENGSNNFPFTGVHNNVLYNPAWGAQSLEPPQQGGNHVVIPNTNADELTATGPSDVYSVVVKHRKPERRSQRTEQSPSRTTNKDGLIYLDVEFVSQTDTNGTDQVVIHGAENKCEYGEIDFSRKATVADGDLKE
ncbi:hemicentin-1-like isoform X2 [Argopecten irradians]|uniref:hemicentin-1-like isoform X2 n=1 Tax=Argopecten irradians TaxID=31199 RepID=UPI003715AD64